MTLTLEQAREIASRKLDEIAGGIELRILDETVQDLGEGWLFGYQSAKFLETGAFADSLVGNVPLFVTKGDGRTFFLSHHRSLSESMAAYRACGDPNATLLPEIELVGWIPGASAITAIKGIRQHSSLGLGEAKSIIERCLAGERCVVRAPDIDQAKSMVATLGTAGFKSHIRYG